MSFVVGGGGGGGGGAGGGGGGGLRFGSDGSVGGIEELQASNRWD